MESRGLLSVAIVLFGFSMVVGGRVSEHAREYRLPSAGAGRSLGSRVAEGFAVRKVMADMCWFDVLQYSGSVEFIIERGKKLPRLVDLATDIDPTFTHVYMFGAGLLMWQGDRPQAAARVLKKGILFNPKHERMQQYLAAFTYRRMDELAKEVQVLEKLAFAEDSSFILRRILANAYAKQGRYRRAAVVARHVLDTSPNERERRWASTKLEAYKRKLGNR